MSGKSLLVETNDEEGPQPYNENRSDGMDGWNGWKSFLEETIDEEGPQPYNENGNRMGMAGMG